MTRIVMKFGGTSVANIECIARAALRVEEEVKQGNQVCIVVSAMAGETNKLVGFVDALGPTFDAREYDAIVASGEIVTAGLMALTLQNMGIDARSWQGWQIPIKTDSSHGKARIVDIEPTAMITQLNNNIVAICAGFQGVADNNRVSTLGRGGSDTSAVALAAALDADRCDIYTDVDGIYSADPRIVPTARKLDIVYHEEMLELASLGAKVLHLRAVELAVNHNVSLQVRSTFDNISGTIIKQEHKDDVMEKQQVTGIAHTVNEAKVTIVKVPDRPGVAASIFTPLADAFINVDMIVQSVSKDDGCTDMTFTIPVTDLTQALKLLEAQEQIIGYQKILHDANVAKISVVGVGMRSYAGVAQKMFETLASKSINIQAVSTSEIRVSCVIDQDSIELAMRSLHHAFGLDA